MKVENDTGTEDVELLNLLAENQDPLNLSEGVTTLFQAKKGGNVRLGPHKATDLLVKKTTTGERPKYQPPGGGATSLGSGRDAPGSDRGPRDDPDRFGPTTTRTVAPPGEKGGPGYISPEDQKTLDIKEIISRQEEEKRDQIKKKSNPLWTALKWIGTGAAIIGSGGTALGLGGHKLVQTAQLINKVNKLTNAAVDGYNFINKTNYTKEELFNKIQADAKAVKEERQKKMDLYESLPPGHPEKIALSIELEIGKKPDPLGDDGGTPSISVPVVTEELEEATDEGAIDMFDAWGEIKRKQALNASLQAKWAAEQEARDQSFIVANRGGLANLFRVKKQ